MMMKEFKYRFWLIFDYLIVLGLFGVLIGLSLTLNTFRFLIMSFPIIMIVICLYYFYRQLRLRHILGNESLIVTYRDKIVLEIKYEDIKEIKRENNDLEITYAYKNKRKAHHISSTLKDYGEFVDELKTRLVELEYWNDIYIIRW